MDKVIIDGVDVKDCKRRIGKNSYCRYFKRPCADNNFNCIWKQHERLKEENERVNVLLQKACKEVEWVRNKYADNYSELKAENERLKENDCEQCKHLDLYIKYKQTLQEIKDIVNKAYYTEDYMLGERFTELVDAINLTITNIIGTEE